MWPDASRVRGEELVLGDAGVMIQTQLADVGEDAREEGPGGESEPQLNGFEDGVRGLLE